MFKRLFKEWLRSGLRRRLGPALRTGIGADVCTLKGLGEP